MQNPDEIWQAEVNGEIYETTFGELTNWINENSLLETDKVRRGNLRWLEAGRVPPLREFFNAKANGTEPPFVYVSTNQGNPSPINPSVESNNFSDNQFVENTTDAQATESFPQVEENQFQSDTGVCNIHPEIPSEYICQACSHAFCKECPQGFGSSVKICPYCGAMCKEIKAFQTAQQKEFQYRKDIDGGFTFGDFGKALAYPFKFKSSLFWGGLLLAILSLGQKSAAMGSIFLAVGALFCFMFANALTFGVLANAIDNFSQGFTDRNFLPSFDDFSLWDDVIHPFFLSIAVWVSSFGLFFALVVGMVWYSWNMFTSQMSPNAEMPMSQANEQVEAKKHVEALLDKYKKQNAVRQAESLGEDGLTEGQRANLEEEAEFERVNELINNQRQQQVESTLGKTSEQQQAAMSALVWQFVKVAGIFLIFAGLALLWGLFYFPAACAVAGYTRSFVATINPLIGLDTIKHLGLDYFKILVMSLIISIMSGFIGIVLAMIFSPFDMPTVGNLPATFIGGFITFYFSVVFAVMLGYALYKNSEKLKLYRS